MFYVKNAALKAGKVILELAFVQPTKHRWIAFIAAVLFLVMMKTIQDYLKNPTNFTDEAVAEHDD